MRELKKMQLKKRTYEQFSNDVMRTDVGLCNTVGDQNEKNENWRSTKYRFGSMNSQRLPSLRCTVKTVRRHELFQTMKIQKSRRNEY